MSYDPNDDPAEAIRKAIEHRTAIVPVRPKRQEPEPQRVQLVVARVVKAKAKPEPEPDPEERDTEPPGFPDLPDTDGPDAAEAITDWLSATERLLQSAGREIGKEGSLARKQTHELIDEVASAAGTVLGAIMDPSKFKDRL
jgi:hypothetical protein